VLSLLLISLLEKIALKSGEVCYNIFKEIRICELWLVERIVSPSILN